MKDLLRKIPKVDDILKHEKWRTLNRYPEAVAKDRLRDVLNELRAAIRVGDTGTVPPAEAIIEDTKKRTAKSLSPALKRVINGTGVIIHTNLGRSPLADSVVGSLAAIASGYSNLEYDLEGATRGDRYEHCLSLLRNLTGAESALIVNNNAAAVLLILNTLADGKEVIIGRGELIEIGGSFRIPEVMRKSGATLREVGTTNRTFAQDYEQAINEQTGLIMKAHTSNYRIKGFVHEATSEELAELAALRHIPFYFDVGSGLFSSLRSDITSSEPYVADEVKKNASVISFSGDKLLGGPQAGIILGKTELVGAMKEEPPYEGPEARQIHAGRARGHAASVSRSGPGKAGDSGLEDVSPGRRGAQKRASRVARILRKSSPAARVDVVKMESEVGGGSLPDVQIPSWGFSLLPSLVTVEGFEQAMRALDVPVVGRIEKGRFLIDMRTIQPGDEKALVAGIETALRDGK